MKMTVELYTLWPTQDRTKSKTGKLHRVAIAAIAATSPQQARTCAMMLDKHGLPWDDPEHFEVKVSACFGTLPAEGFASFQIDEGWEAI